MSFNFANNYEQTTFSNALVTHMKDNGRHGHLVNLDPAAERFEWEPTVDVRDLISLEDVMEEFHDGPNGGLIHCMEYLLANLDWLEDAIDDYDDDFLIFDLPGQIELFTHVPILPSICRHLSVRMGFRLCATYLIDSTFISDTSKFLAGSLSAMSAMLMLETPHLNILSKTDLLPPTFSKRQLRKFLNLDLDAISRLANKETGKQFADLNSSIMRLLEDFHMVNFLPLNIEDSDSLKRILSYIDDAVQWDEDQEPKEPVEFDEEDLEACI